MAPQGTAALVVMPSGKTLLIDSGKNGQRIRNVMQQASVTQIDAFVDSHYHEDHVGAIDDLVDTSVPVLESHDRGDKACCLPQSKKNQVTFGAGAIVTADVVATTCLTIRRSGLS